MSNTKVIDILRASRKADDVIDRLRANSLEARRDKIAEALESDDWEFGPAELIYTYEHHVLANKNGELVQVAISEDKEGNVKLGEAKLKTIATPVNNLAFEMLETAKSAINFIINENFADAMPIISNIAKNVDVKGELQRQLNMEVALRSLDREPWYATKTDNNVDANIVRVITHEDVEEIKLRIDNLVNRFRGSLAELASSSTSINLEANDQKFAKDLIEDVKLIINTLQSINREDRPEMIRVYEAVAKNGNKYFSSLNKLAKKLKSKAGDETNSEVDEKE